MPCPLLSHTCQNDGTDHQDMPETRLYEIWNVLKNRLLSFTIAQYHVTSDVVHVWKTDWSTDRQVSIYGIHSVSEECLIKLQYGHPFFFLLTSKSHILCHPAIFEYSSVKPFLCGPSVLFPSIFHMRQFFSNRCYIV